MQLGDPCLVAVLIFITRLSGESKMRKDFFGAQCVCFTFKLLRINDKGGREKCVIVEIFLPLRMLWALRWGIKRKKELRIAQLLLSTVDQLGLEPRTSRL